MPKIGDRVHVTPAPGEAVQRGRDLFGQFLPPNGAEVVWDAYHQQRLQDGSLVLPPEHYHRARLEVALRQREQAAQARKAQLEALKSQGAKADPKEVEACGKELAALEAERKQMVAQLEALEGRGPKKSTGGEG